jgi:hypothetical protein
VLGFKKERNYNVIARSRRRRACALKRYGAQAWQSPYKTWDLFVFKTLRLPLGREPLGLELGAERLEAEWLRFARNDH